MSTAAMGEFMLLERRHEHRVNGAAHGQRTRVLGL